MKLNTKGFTLVELLAVVTILGIISGIATISYNKYQQKVIMDSYKTMESSAYSAAQNYIQQQGVVVPSDGSEIVITINTLVNSGLLSKLQDPKAKGSFCHSGSSVKVKKQQSAGTKLEVYTYEVIIKCRDYTSSGVVFNS